MLPVVGAARRREGRELLVAVVAVVVARAGAATGATTLGISIEYKKWLALYTYTIFKIEITYQDAENTVFLHC